MDEHQRLPTNSSPTLHRVTYKEGTRNEQIVGDLANALCMSKVYIERELTRLYTLPIDRSVRELIKETKADLRLAKRKLKEYGHLTLSERTSTPCPMLVLQI